MEIDPRRTALLSMDFHRGMVANSEMAQQRDLVNKARSVLETARQAGMTVIHVGVRPRTGFISLRNKFVNMIRSRGPAPSHDAMKIVEALQPIADEPEIIKPRVNAFYGSDLELLLRSRDIDTLLLMGVTTEMVVESTARQAMDSDYRVIVLEDCCASSQQGYHDNSILVMERMAEISNAQQFVESLKPA